MVWIGVETLIAMNGATAGSQDRGIDIRLVQAALGHAKLSTTAIYLQRRIAIDELRNALEGRRYAL